jgi:hypothetical protein
MYGISDADCAERMKGLKNRKKKTSFFIVEMVFGSKKLTQWSK